MRRRGAKRIGVVLGLLGALLPCGGARAQSLAEIYVSEAGVVLGALFAFNPGFPAHAFVKGNGVLVWVNLEIPGAMVEVNPLGDVRLVERAPSGSISYRDGRISRIGDLRLEYDSGRLQKMGALVFQYAHHRSGLSRIGEVSLDVEDGFLRRFGPVLLEYENGVFRRIDGLAFAYESGRVERIGGVRFQYDWGTLRQAAGEIPGVALKITSVVEFRRSIR